MTVSTILYFISVLLTLALTGFLAWYAWRKPPMPGARAYAGLALGECLLALVEILSLVSASPAQAHFWFNLRFLFSGTIPVLFLVFALEYLGRKDWLSRPLLVLAFSIPALSQLFIWTNSQTGLWVKQDVSFHQNGLFWMADTGTRIPAAWFMVHSFYSLILLLAGIILILLVAWRKRQEQRGQAVLLVAGALVALVTSLIPVFNLFPQLAFNPFVPGIGVSALLYALAIFRFQFLKRSPAQASAGLPPPIRLQENHSLAVFIFIFILFATGIAAVGYVSYQNYENQYRLQVDKQLTAISELKVNQLETWRSERLGDAEILYHTPAFSALVGSFLTNSGDAQASVQLQGWLEAVRSAEGYERVFLLDAHGVERLASPENTSEPVSAYLAGQADAVLGLGQVTFMDFHRDTPSGPVHISLLVPVYAGGDRSRPLGVLVLRVDPALTLYPFIQEWPTSSSTAETLLVRRDGNNVLFLNELRFEKNTALNLQFPLDDTQVLAVKAVLGQTGIVSGVDYRGQPVIGYVGPVPESPWFLVTRMDASEVYAPLRERLWEMLAFFGALILAAGAGLWLLWRQQGLRYYRAQVAVAQALRDSELRYRRLFEAARDGILILDSETGVVANVNPFLIEMLGFPREEIVGKKLWELGSFKDIAASQANFLELQQKEYVRYEDLPLETADGRKFYVEFVSNVYQVDHHKVIQCNIRDITERKQAEEKLAQEQYLLHSLMENLPEHIYFKDRASRFTNITNSHARQFGLSDPAEALGKTDFDFYTEEHARPAFEAEQKIIATGQPVMDLEEKETWQKDGRVTWVKTTKMPLLDRAGQIIGTFGISTDVTEHKQLEGALREANEYLENLINYANAPIIVWDPTFRITRFNHAFESLTGLRSAQVLGQSLELLFPPDQAQASMQLIRKTLTGERWEVVEINIRHVDGSIHTVLWNSATLFSADGKTPLATIAQGQDVTERKRSENILNARLRLVEFAANHSLAELLQQTLDEVCAVTDSPIGFYDFVEPDQKTLSHQTWSTRTLQEYCQAEASGGHFSIEEAGVWVDCIRQRKAIIHNDYAALPHRHGLPEGHAALVRELVVPIFRDELIVAILGIGNRAQEYTEKDIEVVTFFADVAWEIFRRKQAEQDLQAYSEYLEEMVNERTRELRDAQEKMVRQERLATLGQLAGSVGHELRNPLGVISNAVYFLKMTQPDASETVLEYLDIIEKETKTSDKIVTDLLDFTRIKAVDREPLTVSDLVAQTLKRYPVPAAVEVQLDLQAGLPPVYADPRQVVQVLGNLVTNACQAISLPDGAPQAGKLTLSASLQGDMIAIAVKDTGVGIPPENMGKLFEPLFTTKIKGIGLGLAVSQKLAEANGGRIEARSKPGKGSTFTVYLPMVRL
jgi:PAS domain S-box-containing protein